jgi:hypothetical protein
MVHAVVVVCTWVIVGVVVAAGVGGNFSMVPLSPEITVLNALIIHSEEYFLPALDNIRPVSPIMEDRQLLDMSLGVNNDTLLSPKSQQHRLYQTR